MGRRRRRAKRRRRAAAAKRAATSQATKQAVVKKRGAAQQTQATTTAAQAQQQQQTQGPQAVGIGSAVSNMADVMSGKRPADARPASAARPGRGGKMATAAGSALPGGGRGPAKPGRGRGKMGGRRPIDKGTGDRDMGGGYRNRAFGMGRGERGYGMGRDGGGGRMMPDFMQGRQGVGREAAFGMGREGRGFGMDRRGRDVMQSDVRGGGGKGGRRPLPRQPQGRPNPYGQVDMSLGRGMVPGTGTRGPGGGGRGGGGGSSFNPKTGRMEYASTPNNFSPRSQRGGGGGGARTFPGPFGPVTQTGGFANPPRRGGDGGGFKGRRSAAFPAMAAMFSDIRMKENIERTGTSQSGIPIYEFNYIDDNNRYNGAIAQDLLAMGKKDAVHKDKETGYYKIDYSQIDVSLTLKN